MREKDNGTNFMTAPPPKKNKWIVNYAMRNIRPRLTCRSVVISE